MDRWIFQEWFVIVVGNFSVKDFIKCYSVIKD